MTPEEIKSLIPMSSAEELSGLAKKVTSLLEALGKKNDTGKQLLQQHSIELHEMENVSDEMLTESQDILDNITDQLIQAEKAGKM